MGRRQLSHQLLRWPNDADRIFPDAYASSCLDLVGWCRRVSVGKFVSLDSGGFSGWSGGGPFQDESPTIALMIGVGIGALVVMGAIFFLCKVVCKARKPSVGATSATSTTSMATASAMPVATASAMPVAIAHAVSAQSAVVASAQAMTCPACGSEMRESAKFCVKCGTSVAP